MNKILILFTNPHTLKSPTTLYTPIEGVWSPAGGYKVSEDCQAFEARCQDSRHFEAVDSELALCQTSKHVS